MVSWSKLTYSGRLFMCLVIYSVMIVAFILFFQYQREKDFKAELLNTRLQVLNRSLLRQQKEGVIDPGRLDTEDLEGVRISVIDTVGNVIYDNSLDILPETNHLGRKEIADAIAYGSGFTLRRHSQSTGQTYFYSARRGDNGVIVRTAVPYTVSLNSLLEADRGYIWFLGALTVVMCSIGYVVTSRMGQHVQRLRRFAEKAETGVEIQNMEPFPHDELGDISNNIVRLYASLHKAIAERDREHKAALHEQREKERIKKQLTNNINHELKTPVASMQLCLETLLAHPGMDPAKRKEFLERCLANNSRLRQLLADVSLITRMEDGATSIECETIDLSAVIHMVVAEREEKAQSKEMEIIDEVKEPIYVSGNLSLLESVFFNLIDNAISYSGGDRVTISRRDSSSAGTAIITVCDNGCGVEAIHLPRLFERFYRVDKGRSRSAGGTGLGLAIVKNAMLFHGGSVSVENICGGGLCFTITFPTIVSDAHNGGRRKGESA